MPGDIEGKHDFRLEIAHVLFIDIVGYSKLLTNEQRERQQELNRLVRETEQFRAAEAEDKLVRIPTGDGMVLAFFTSPDAPVRCAVAISHALRGTSHLPLRMGIHSGPVDLVSDVNDKPNLAGAGVNIAQRVMNCGDAGHILLSARAADDLAQYGEWKSQLHEIGEVEVKHRVRVRVVSLYSDGVGNAALPQTLRRQRLVRRRRFFAVSTVAAILVLALALGTWAWQRQAKLREQAAAEAVANRAKSVAVLPFENLSTEEQNAVFAGGVHREVLLNLAKIADLKVISRTSVMRYKPGTDRNLKQIADELGVSYIVEGSVQREAGHVRVSVELIDARTDTHAWAESYDGNVADVLAFQSEIAQRITNQLGAKLSPRESTELASRPTHDIAAFESYIRARALMEISDADRDDDKVRDDYTRAVQFIEQAVGRDPKFASAYWALTEANIQLFRNSDPPNPEYRARAEAALKEAHRLAPDAGETLHADARVIYYGYRDFTRALATLERAAKLLPNSADVTMTRALLYRRFGRWQEAYAQFERATELNPQDPTGYYSAANTARGLRWWDEADRVRARLIKRFPRMIRGARIEQAVQLRWSGEVDAGDKILEELNLDVRSDFAPLFYRSFWKRDYQECRRLLAEAAKYPDLERDRWEKELKLAFVTKTPGPKQAALEAEKQLEERLRRPSNRDDEGELTDTLSCVKFILGKKDEAVRLCEQSVEKHPLSEDALANTARVKWLAYAYIYAGDHERALQSFAKLVQIPFGEYYGPLKYEPVFDELRKDPRFDEILKQSQKPFPRL
jgi:TolB-like protein/class 3 adenylate cyclase/Flp pilus assembly protein TadD